MLARLPPYPLPLERIERVIHQSELLRLEAEIKVKETREREGAAPAPTPLFPVYFTYFLDNRRLPE